MSLIERPVHADVRSMLVNNEPHQYAHLVKFERPTRPNEISGQVSTAAKRYTYITDASRNVSFDDGSTDSFGTANGTQIYLANRLLSVGAISEQTEAQAGNTSLRLDGNAVGAFIQDTITISSVDSSTWDLVWPIYSNPLDSGFREGDKVALYYSGSTKKVSIDSFRANNTIRVKKIDDALTTGTVSVTMSLASEEIISILLDKSADDYASFINREVYIWRAFFDDGTLVGTPVLMFKGIVQNVSFEDTDTSVVVSWGLTSHWGDFSQVKGRITSDSFHRALNSDAVPQPQSALKPVYAYDKGFMHAETAIHMLTKYVAQVERQDITVKNGFLGLFPKVKVKKYMAAEDRFTNLDLQLEAKSIPLVYGVRLVDGIPIFADTLNNDSGTVYIVYALCEGEIGAIYDVYIDGLSLICNDKADYDSRHAQTADNTVGLICRGRADAGEVLDESLLDMTVEQPSSAPVDYYNDMLAGYSNDYALVGSNIANTTFVEPGIYAEANSAGMTGILNRETIKLTSPQEIELEFYSGRTDQRASPTLTKIAYDEMFKIQNSYWKGASTEEYWGPNHRLIDTAYVVAKVKIKEGESTIPELRFLIKAKFIECYNYDQAFDSNAYGSTLSTLKLGDYVDVFITHPVSGTMTQVKTAAQIVDKWSFYDNVGTKLTRIKIDSQIDLIVGSDGHPTVTDVHIAPAGLGIGYAIDFYTYRKVSYSGTISESIYATASGAGPGDLPYGDYIKIDYSSQPYFTVGGDSEESSPALSVVDSNMDFYTDQGILNTLILFGTVTSTSVTTILNYSKFIGLLSPSINAKLLASRNTIKLPSGASAANGAYVDKVIEVTRVLVDGKVDKQTGTIVAYDGATRIATIGSLWSYIPKSGDSVRILNADKRVSTNTAMQILDYFTSTTYGRGLSIEKDIDLESFKEVARYYDGGSDVTIRVTSGTAVVGAKYKLNYTNFTFQGTVKSIDGNYVTFTDVIGKLTNKWNSWKSWQVDDIVYKASDFTHYRITTGGVCSTESALATNGTPESSLILVKVGGGTSLTVSTTNGNPVVSTRNGKEISGYSLYDCDSINYWRQLGWDEHSQRNVTRSQTNLQIDTAAPLFDNTNAMLEHCWGILRYSGGRYYMDAEKLETALNVDDIRIITNDDIIGKIQLSDEGTRSSYNSITASFPDPSNKFEARNISFFNSEYLKIDRGIQRKGNLTVPGITNYYNTRLLADTFLNKSRFGLTINMTVRHHGMLMLAGTKIEVNYSRYGWVNKPFRISNITYQSDGLVDIVAKEYDDSFYSASHVSKPSMSGLTNKTDRVLSVGSPSDLIVTNTSTLDETQNGINLSWTNHPSAVSSSVVTEVYGSKCPHFNLNVTAITSDSMTTTEDPHNLVVGMPIISEQDLVVASVTYLEKDKIYYVRSVDVGTHKFTISNLRKHPTNPALPAPIHDLPDGTGLNLIFRTAMLLGTVAIPGNTFIDTVLDTNTSRVEKYYWVRHKVTE